MEYDWLIWLGIAIALAGIEALTVDLVFLMLAGGAVAGSAAAAAGAPFYVQAVVAVAVAVGMLVVVRPRVKERFTVDKVAKIGPGGYVGRSAVVVEPVTRDSGLVKLVGEVWTARSGDSLTHPAGVEVRVSAIDGATAVVVSAAQPPSSGLVIDPKNS